MSKKPSVSTDFNGENVIQSFMVPPEHTAIAAAMRFMFRITKDELPIATTNAAQHLKDVTELTVQAIEYRYCLLKEFADNFFFGEDFDADALAVAAICDSYTEYFGEPVKTTDGDMIENNFQIDPDVAARAKELWEDAFSLMQKAIAPHECSEEAIFLAHILAFEQLAKHEASYEEYDDSVFRKIAHEEIPATRAFLRPGTDIGNHLNNFLGYMEQEVTVRFVANSPAAPTRPPRDVAPTKPKLTLVPPAPNG